MRRWEDVLPPEIAKEQTAWERRAQLLRLSKSGVSKHEMQIFAGNVSQVFVNFMLRDARAKQRSPIESWLQDDTPIRDLANKINVRTRREARQRRNQCYTCHHIHADHPHGHHPETAEPDPMTTKNLSPKRPAMTPAELKAVRADLGLTQTEMADRCGCSLNAIKQYETGKRPIPEMLRKLTYYLLTEHEKRN